MSRERRQPSLLARTLAWLMCVGLLVFSVPWYFASGREPELWLGLPDWVVLSLAACVGVALATAWMIHRFWPAADGDNPGQDET